MKKRILKISILIIGILFALKLTSNAAVITSTDKTVQGGENVTVSVTSSQLLGAYKVTLTDTGGLTLVSSSGGEASSDKKTITGASSSGTKSLASYTFKTSTVDKDTKYTIRFTISAMEDVNLNSIANENNTATITVKAKEEASATTDPGTTTNNGGSTSNNGGSTTSAPTFTSVNETVYATATVNVRESYSSSSSKLGSLNAGDSVTRTGRGSNGWSRITFNGKTAYVSSSYLTTTKPEKSNNKALSSLTVTPGTLSPEFDAETTNYEMTVDLSVTEIKVDAVAADEKAKVEVTGNTELKEGENTITIKVTAEDETVRNYIITVTKKAEEPIGLATLTLKNGKLTPAFQKDVYTYEVTLTEDLSEIEIDAIASIEGASVEVIGNENLTDGSIIKILVYSGEKDAEDTVITEYQITIRKNLAGSVVETQGEVALLSQNHLLYIATIVLVTIAIIALLIARYFTTKGEKEEQNEVPDLQETIGKKEENEEVEKERIEEPEQTEEVETSEKRGKSKGKHSI